MHNCQKAGRYGCPQAVGGILIIALREWMMLRALVCTLLSGLVVISTTGCGAIFSGSTDTITVRSLPKGARVYVDGNNVGASPVSFTVKSRRTHTVEVEAPDTVDGAPQRSNASYLAEEKWRGRGR